MSITTHASTNLAAAAPLPFPPPTEAREPAALERATSRLRRRLDSLLKGIKSRGAQEAAGHVFASLSRQLEIMRIVEINVREGGSPAVTLAALALAESESRALVRFVETRAAKIKGAQGGLREALDAMSFALRHELKAVFGHDLAALAEGRGTSAMRAEFMRAHGLLSNCFQQLLLNLARVFDPAVSGELLFDDYRVRFNESSTLLRELSALALLARRAAEFPDGEASKEFLSGLQAFRRQTMHYLMYKDWDEFSDIAREIVSSHGSARHGFLLRSFDTYLETLTNQVRMRSVLNDQPLDATGHERLKKPRASRRSPNAKPARGTRRAAASRPAR
ncbi:MAG: hypothetical protein LC746_18340 [Acidobacteria bacterium]|nr:hypothetical protein [Acidobacteriota bacterium]